MKKAIIYSRVGYFQVDQECYSILSQENDCYEYAKKNGYEVIKNFSDVGKGGANMKRPGLMNLIQECQKNKTINAVIVQDICKLSRNYNDYFAIKAIFKKEGIKLISLTHPEIDGSSMEKILAEINHHSSRILSRRIKRGKLMAKLRKLEIV